VSNGLVTPRKEGFVKQTQVMLLGEWLSDDLASRLAGYQLVGNSIYDNTNALVLRIRRAYMKQIGPIVGERTVHAVTISQPFIGYVSKL
jgi:hypothetical protein